MDGAPKARNSKIKQEHAEFLVNLVEKKMHYGWIAREVFCKMLEKLDMSESNLKKHM